MTWKYRRIFLLCAVKPHHDGVASKSVRCCVCESLLRKHSTWQSNQQTARRLILQIPSVLVWLAMHRKHLATLKVNGGYLCVDCVMATYNLPLWSQGDPSGVMIAKVCKLWRQITRGSWGQDQFLPSSSSSPAVKAPRTYERLIACPCPPLLPTPFPRLETIIPHFENVAFITQ